MGGSSSLKWYDGSIQSLNQETGNRLTMATLWETTLHLSTVNHFLFFLSCSVHCEMNELDMHAKFRAKVPAKEISNVSTAISLHTNIYIRTYFYCSGLKKKNPTWNLCVRVLITRRDSICFWLIALLRNIIYVDVLYGNKNCFDKKWKFHSAPGSGPCPLWYSFGRAPVADPRS